MQNICAETVEILNRRGLHARAAALFVKEAERFSAHITVSCHERSVPGTSIMGLMMLTASMGTKIQLHAEGSDAPEAIECLKELIANKFNEE